MSHSVERISNAVIAAFPKLTSPEQRLSLATYRLLARGTPVATQAVAAEAGMALADAARLLDSWHGVERDRHGAITAFWGLTLSTTKHRFRVPEGQLCTWCAWDTLFLPALIGASADVESTCPVTRARISLRVATTGVLSVTPQQVVLSFVVPSEADIARSVTETFCCHVHFFASRDAGEEWAATRPEILLLALEEGWEIGARKNAAQFGAALHQIA